MNKKNILILFLSYLVFIIGGIWSLVSFILYLVKDVDFNFTAVVVLFIGLIGMLTQFFKTFFRNKI